MNNYRKLRFTFALFAYNQENFIREAVDGALSQACQPLEIILSDDCSTDSTFNIMKDMAAQYNGPHQVIARQNSKNLGLIDHINTVFRLAQGEWIVVAAGDDISLENRVAEIAKVITEYPDITLVSSALVSIDEYGKEGEVNNLFNLKEKHCIDNVVISGMPEFLEGNSPFAHGATLAYSKKIIDSFPPMRVDAVYEDAIYQFRSALLGHNAHINKVLVMYRTHYSQTTNVSNTDPSTFLKKNIQLTRGGYETCKQKLDDFHCSQIDDCILCDKIKSLLLYEIKYHRFRYLSFSLVWPFRIVPFLVAINMPYHKKPKFTKRQILGVILPNVISKTILSYRLNNLQNNKTNCRR